MEKVKSRHKLRDYHVKFRENDDLRLKWFYEFVLQTLIVVFQRYYRLFIGFPHQLEKLLHPKSGLQIAILLLQQLYLRLVIYIFLFVILLTLMVHGRFIINTALCFWKFSKELVSAPFDWHWLGSEVFFIQRGCNLHCLIASKNRFVGRVLSTTSNFVVGNAYFKSLICHYVTQWSILNLIYYKLIFITK